MASDRHSLQQQRLNLEARIKTLINNDLKELCKQYGQPVSGLKTVLQRRVIDVLNHIVSSGDVDRFEELRYRVSNHGHGPAAHSPSMQPPPPKSSYKHTQHTHTQHAPPHPSPARSRETPTQNRLPPKGHFFRRSPFYEVKDTLLPLQDLPEMPQNRNTVKASLTIQPEVAQMIRQDNNLKIMMFCGPAHSLSPNVQADISFPNQIEVKINDQEVKANFKGLKNKSGSTKPADLTALVRKMNKQPNNIQVTYALTTKRYAYVVHLVLYHPPETLTQRIKRGRAIPPEKVIAELQKANADPDLAATSFRMSLKDPVSTMRIALPVRSSICTHNQCFDCSFFLQLQDQAPQWSCPICSKSLTFESLCVDQYFEHILLSTSRSIEKVDIEPNGEWRAVQEEDDNQKAKTSSRNHRAAYDDDFDDEDEDIIELDSPPAARKSINGMGTQTLGISLPPSAGIGFGVGTPPFSSREPSIAQSITSTTRGSEKRPSAAPVIDLTASDDEEASPRPAKRHQTSNLAQDRRSEAYETPTSVNDLFPFAANAQSLSDPYRPSSNHSSSRMPSVPPKGFNANSPLLSTRPPAAVSPFQQAAWNPSTAPNTLAPQQTYNNNVWQPSQSFHSPQFGGSDGTGSRSLASNIRLPPIQNLSPSQSNQSSQHGGWRSDYNSFSQSPPG